MLQYIKTVLFPGDKTPLLKKPEVPAGHGGYAADANENAGNKKTDAARETNKLCEDWKTRYGIEVFRKPFTTWNTADSEINALGDAPEAIRAQTCEITAPAATFCATPWSHMSINWDGTVVPCCRDYSNLYLCGDIHETALIDIWNSKKMQRLRQEIRSGRVSNALCGVCDRTIHTPTGRRNV